MPEDETCEDLLEKIVKNLEISRKNFEDFCPGVSRSRRFLDLVLYLSIRCGDWNKIQSLLKAGRKRRLTERPRRVNHRREWVPWDAQNATAIWRKMPAPSLKMSDVTRDTTIECARDKKVHIIFCGVSRYSDISTAPSEFISVPIYPAYSAYGGKFLQRFSRKFLENLERQLGRGLVARGSPSVVGQDEYFVVHQNVLAMIAAEESGLVSIELRSMEWVSEMVATHGFPGHVKGILADKVVIYAPWEDEQMNDDITQDFYFQTQEATAFHKKLRVYPNYEESNSSGLKLTDIAALERIAEDDATPLEFSHRPRTCLGRGQCAMADWSDKMVLKRNFSCGSHNVSIVPGHKKTSWSNLACTGRKHESTRRKADGKTTLFHQEYVKGLEEWGEIRVIVAGGQIIKRSRTQWIKESKAPRDVLYPRQLELKDDFSWYSEDPEKQGEKLKQLDEFCMHIYRSITSLPEAERYFESFFVGVRLDIGILDNGFFFVNEPTRWYAADWFNSQLSGSDPTGIAQQFGKSFAQSMLEK